MLIAGLIILILGILSWIRYNSGPAGYALMIGGLILICIGIAYAKPAWREVCVVIHQVGVVRNASEQEIKQGIEFPCGLNDDEALRFYFQHNKTGWWDRQ